MSQRLCAERCSKPSVSDYNVSILQPVNFKDQSYRNYLQALSIATDGAFHFNEPGEQAIEVVSPLRTAEKIFAKNGRVFDLSCLKKVKATIASLAMEGACLNPLIDCEDSALQLKKKNSDYELWMKFEPDSRHRESLLTLADILAGMATEAGKQIHTADMGILDKNNPILELKIGFIATRELDDFLLSDIEFANNQVGYTPLGVICEAYSYKCEQKPDTLTALRTFEDKTTSIKFDPLTIGLRKRITKRSS